MLPTPVTDKGGQWLTASTLALPRGKKHYSRFVFFLQAGPIDISGACRGCILTRAFFFTAFDQLEGMLQGAYGSNSVAGTLWEWEIAAWFGFTFSVLNGHRLHGDNTKTLTGKPRSLQVIVKSLKQVGIPMKS